MIHDQDGNVMSLSNVERHILGDMYLAQCNAVSGKFDIKQIKSFDPSCNKEDEQYLQNLIRDGLVTWFVFFDQYAVTKYGVSFLPKQVINSGQERRNKHNRKKREKGFNYYERDSAHKFGKLASRKTMCRVCWAYNVPCPHNGHFNNWENLVPLPPDARPPTVDANKTKWKQFFQLFIPTVLENSNWWEDRNQALKDWYK